MTYLTDNATTEDALDFGDFRAALKEIVTTAQTPLTVGIFGTWGSGKTSLMRMVRHDIEAGKLPAYRTVWFTAWKYDQQDVLWRALILRVLDALYPREDGDGPREERDILEKEKRTPQQERLIQLLNQLEESVYQAVDWDEIGPRAINWWQFVSGVSKAGLETAATLGTAGIFPQLKKAFGADDTPVDDIKKAAEAISKEAKQYHRRQLHHLEEFEKMFKEAVELIAPDKKGRLIVFVDDLDRCLPEKAIEVIEAIKLFLEAAGVVFVLGMDKEVVQKGIKAHYGAHFHQAPNDHSELPISGDSYLQKVVQIPFHLPSLAAEDLDKFIDKLAGGMSVRTRQVIAQGVLPNPRQVKRALNIFNLLRTIADHRFKENSDQIADPLLAKTVLIQTQHPALYQLWRQYPVVVQMLEEAYDRDRISDEEILTGRPSRSQQAGQPEIDAAAESQQPERPGKAGQLDKYLNDRAAYARLARMLTYPADDEAGKGRDLARFGGLNLSQLAAYVRLAGAVESEAVEPPLVELPSDLLAQFLSGDDLEIRTAASQLESEALEQREPKRKAVQEQLVQVVDNPARPTVERVSAGKALAFVGDPRPGVGVVEKDGLVIPDISWGKEVPAGTYEIGGDKDAYDSFEKRQVVIERPYRLAQYPITFAQFQRFVEAPDGNNSKWWQGMPADEQAISEPSFPFANHPRESVSWYQAIAFCRWLTDKLGYAVDLPHEYEWEIAARYKDNRFYPWGNDFEADKANTREGGIGQTTAVGLYPGGQQPELSLYDLSGNVWEWCRNKYKKPDEAWLESERLGPTNPVDASGDGRLLRGGGWSYDHNLARAAARSHGSPGSRYDRLGFRVVRRSPSQDH